MNAVRINKLRPMVLTRTSVCNIMKMVKGRRSEFMKNEVIKNVAGVILFYLAIIAGVLLIDMRMDSLPDSQPSIQISK